MTDKDEKTGDIFGIAPYGEAVNTLAKGAVQGASAFLSRICLPAAEEFGLLLRNKVSGWRSNNAVMIALKAEKTFKKYSNGENLHAHPRLVMKVVEEGSWAENDTVQEMWAGLLTSACTEDGKDETNLIFMNILSQITVFQAFVIKYGCEKSEKKLSKAGWIYAETLIIELDELIKITSVSDIHRLDRELDHLRSLELIGEGGFSGGFQSESTAADITPTSLTLQMYMRCQGYKGSPADYYDIGDQQET